MKFRAIGREWSVEFKHRQPSVIVTGSSDGDVEIINDNGGTKCVVSDGTRTVEGIAERYYLDPWRPVVGRKYSLKYAISGFDLNRDQRRQFYSAYFRQIEAGRAEQRRKASKLAVVRHIQITPMAAQEATQ